ncbi:MAG: acyl-CoA dehydrogenase family protein [Acidimicrobiales bacterium]
MMSRAQSVIEEFVRTDGVNLPLPGSGDTWRRFETLAKWSSKDLSIGRLVEGHADAVAILFEAGMKPVDEGLSYGVWAARSRHGGTVAERVAGGWRLTGSKEFCSGSGIIDRALVTADTKDGYRLFDIALEANVAMIHEDSWPAVGMSDSMSETVEFAGPVVPDTQVVGAPDFYTSRKGFWAGAAGVAACWFGGANGLVRNLVNSLPGEPSEHVLADLGLAVAGLEAMRDVLKGTADALDADPADALGQSRYRALVTRQFVHDAAMNVLARVASAGGARPLCHDAAQSRRAADLYVYLSQHHGGIDAAELGRLARGRDTWN